MATIEKRKGVTVAFVNRKDFAAGEAGDKIFNTYVVGIGGFMAASIKKNPELITALKLNPNLKNIVIVVEEVASQLDPFEVDAIIEHEIAHVKLKHTEAEANYAGCILHQDYELQADQYAAVRHGADVVKSGLMKVMEIIAGHGAPIFGVSREAVLKKLLSDEIVVRRLEALGNMA